MRRIVSAVFLVVLASGVVDAATPPRLKVGPDRRHLVTEDGKPFFYLGDTAWELFHRLEPDEARDYLRDRASKGFTVIQAVALAEFDGLTEPNRQGALPLIDRDPTRPNDAYFRHVDAIVDQANALGLYVGMLPTWGDKWNKAWGTGPEVFTPENARIYGEWLGRRYKDKGIIWILGGDRAPQNERHKAIIRAMAAGLRAGDGGAHLMTFHPQGGRSSSEWFQADDWLDFNLFQSGHGRRDQRNDEFTLRDRARTPVKPTLDGEPRYEDHPIDWKPANGYFDEVDVRQAAYWSMLAGACGHTYGNHNLWQFLDVKRHPPVSAARTPWRQALEQPGAAQMGYLRKLFEANDWQTLEPDQALLSGKLPDGAATIRAARSSEGRRALVYTPTGTPFDLDLSRLKGQTIRASWFDPRTGQTRPIGEWSSEGTTKTQPPTQGRGQDWVLVLEGRS